jgi:hypothetical protein
MSENNSPKQKGKTNNPNGRPKGIPNKVTQDFRDTVRRLLEDNSQNFGRWLSLVAEGDGSEQGKPDPGRALDLIAKLAEFAAPKLGRIEHAGDQEQPMRQITRIEIVSLE